VLKGICPRLAILAALPVWLAVAGCSDYLSDYYYLPRPALAEVPATQPNQPPAVSTLASVIGIHKADAKPAIPQSVQIRIRLENTGTGLLHFDPVSLQLTTGDLFEFDHPLLPEALPNVLQPGQPIAFDVFFPFPPGHDANNVRLDSLQLQWMVQAGDRHIREVINFHRQMEYYYYYQPAWDPYADYPYGYYPRYRYYGGGVIYRR